MSERKQKMTNDLVKKHYSGNQARHYDAMRQSSKWRAEEKFIVDFLRNNTDIKKIIDAPLGTNRFNDVIDECDHIEICWGLELSKDMLTTATKPSIHEKIKYIQADISEKWDETYKGDATIMMRMLNLVEEETALKMFGNALDASSQYVLVSLRVGEPQIIQNKIHVQNYKVFENFAKTKGFVVDQCIKVPTDKVGQYCLISYKKK